MSNQKPISESAPGATGYHLKPREQYFNELADAGVDVQCGREWLAKIKQSAPIGNYSRPQAVNSLEWFEIISQYSIGSCFWASLGQILSCNHYLNTGKQKTYSIWASYKLFLEHTNQNQDNGTDPQRGYWVAQNLGLVPKFRDDGTPLTPAEPQQFQQGWPLTEEMREYASRNLLGPTLDMTQASFQESKDWIMEGGGFVHTLSRWTKPLDDSNNHIVQSFNGGWDPNSQHAGHAYQESGVSVEGNLILPNTWDTHWADEGFKQITEQAYNERREDNMTIRKAIPASTEPKRLEIPLEAGDW